MASVPSQTVAALPSNGTSKERIDVFWHEQMLNHFTGRGVFSKNIDPGFLDVLYNHPENADRVKNMVSILKRGPIAPFVSWHQGRPALISELLTFHTQDYINRLVEADKCEGETEIYSKTYFNPGSWEAALIAAGTTISAMQHITDGHGKISYALVRPPGHHAQPSTADGYCFLNNAGLAIEYALRSTTHINKVVVIDIDVHHGNGAQEGFYRSDKVLTISLHMNHGPRGPQKGTVDELGEGNGFGFNLNIPLPMGTGDKGYEHAMMELVVPAVERFEPNIVVLVAGHDASAFDPNGRQCLTMEGYRRIGKIVRELANKHCDGRLLVVQEGGYHLTYAAYCLHATLEGVLNNPVPILADPIAYYPDDDASARVAVESIKKYHTEFVPFFK